MSDNILQTLQQLVQDVIAPDVRELKVRVTSLEKQIDVRFNALDQKSDAQFKAIMAAIAESKAQAELTNMRMIAALSERVAALGGWAPLSVSFVTTKFIPHIHCPSRTFPPFSVTEVLDGLFIMKAAEKLRAAQPLRSKSNRLGVPVL